MVGCSVQVARNTSQARRVPNLVLGETSGGRFLGILPMADEMHFPDYYKVVERFNARNGTGLKVVSLKNAVAFFISNQNMSLLNKTLREWAKASGTPDYEYTSFPMDAVIAYERDGVPLPEKIRFEYVSFSGYVSPGGKPLSATSMRIGKHEGQKVAEVVTGLDSSCFDVAGNTLAITPPEQAITYALTTRLIAQGARRVVSSISTDLESLALTLTASNLDSSIEFDTASRAPYVGPLVWTCRRSTSAKIGAWMEPFHRLKVMVELPGSDVRKFESVVAAYSRQA